MNDKYLSKNAVIERIKWSGLDSKIIDRVIQKINLVESADVAPVVRCKDCRLRGSEECAMFYRCECGEQHTWETDNDFCSYGERIDT